MASLLLLLQTTALPQSTAPRPLTASTYCCLAPSPPHVRPSPATATWTFISAYGLMASPTYSQIALTPACINLCMSDPSCTRATWGPERGVGAEQGGQACSLSAP